MPPRTAVPKQSSFVVLGSGPGAVGGVGGGEAGPPKVSPSPPEATPRKKSPERKLSSTSSTANMVLAKKTSTTVITLKRVSSVPAPLGPSKQGDKSIAPVLAPSSGGTPNQKHVSLVQAFLRCAISCLQRRTRKQKTNAVQQQVVIVPPPPPRSTVTVASQPKLHPAIAASLSSSSNEFGSIEINDSFDLNGSDMVHDSFEIHAEENTGTATQNPVELNTSNSSQKRKKKYGATGKLKRKPMHIPPQLTEVKLQMLTLIQSYLRHRCSAVMVPKLRKERNPILGHNHQPPTSSPSRGDEQPLAIGRAHHLDVTSSYSTDSVGATPTHAEGKTTEGSSPPSAPPPKAQSPSYTLVWFTKMKTSLCSERCFQFAEALHKQQDGNPGSLDSPFMASYLANLCSECKPVIAQALLSMRKVYRAIVVFQLRFRWRHRRLRKQLALKQQFGGIHPETIAQLSSRTKGRCIRCEPFLECIRERIRAAKQAALGATSDSSSSFSSSPIMSPSHQAQSSSSFVLSPSRATSSKALTSPSMDTEEQGKPTRVGAPPGTEQEVEADTPRALGTPKVSNVGLRGVLSFRRRMPQKQKEKLVKELHQILFELCERCKEIGLAELRSIR